MPMLDNLDEIEKFLERHKLPKLTQENLKKNTKQTEKTYSK